MDFVETLTTRNAEFAEHGFLAELKIILSTRTLIIGCVDPRVDPMDILKLKPGEAAIIRNVGGLVTLRNDRDAKPAASGVRARTGSRWGPGAPSIVLHHTQCGIIGCHRHAPDLLARHMGIAPNRLECAGNYRPL